LTIEEEVESIVNGSGNSFHCRVANYFQDHGWHTMLSPYYMDSSANKPREIDLIAEKAWPYRDDYDQKYGTVHVKLFIECKYIPQLNVFWFDQKDLTASKEWLLSNTGFPDQNVMVQRHHYLATNQNVAKLFASKNKQAVENEVIYKAINQSLNSMVYLRNRDTIIPFEHGRRVNVLEMMEMPVIVCNSFENFYRTNVQGENQAERLDDNFQLEINYAFVDQNKNHRNEYFLIDVVDFNQLDNFFELIEADVGAVFDII
jgi:hypothetical protein